MANVQDVEHTVGKNELLAGVAQTSALTHELIA
jgi:hypothetical protein